MRTFRQSGSRNRGIRSILFAGLVLGLAMTMACQSGPARTLRGARHYTAGTEALDRGDAELAILELERAAELVPQASEIQNHLGLAYWSEGRTGEARFAFERALELDCDNAAAQTNLDGLLQARVPNRDRRREDTPQGDPDRVNANLSVETLMDDSDRGG